MAPYNNYRLPQTSHQGCSEQTKYGNPCVSKSCWPWGTLHVCLALCLLHATFQSDLRAAIPQGYEAKQLLKGGVFFVVSSQVSQSLHCLLCQAWCMCELKQQECSGLQALYSSHRLATPCLAVITNISPTYSQWHLTSHPPPTHLPASQPLLRLPVNCLC